MIVSDVYNDAQEVLGFCSQSKIFSRLTDAIEALANKGQWEPLLAYLSIATTDTIYVLLPEEVEIPLRINLDSNPAFTRDRMYEFTMNGPGSSDPRVDWSWEDLGETPGINADDMGNVIDPEQVLIPFTKRRIRISQAGAAVRALVRLRTVTITSMTQFIPLNSKLAILMMLKALESFKRGTPQDFQLGQMQEEQALKFLQEEQKSRSGFSEIAKTIDQPPIVGYAYHSNNLVIVGDIYDEASAICGGINRIHVIDRISEAVEVLANKGQWDGMTAYLDIVPSGDVVGLPSFVETPIRINIETKPSLSRSRMFEFSINGPGTDLTEVTTLTWEDQGDSPIIVPLVKPQPVNIVATNQVDGGKTVTITGIDNNDQEQTIVYTIPFIQGIQISHPTIWKTITRIQKDVTLQPVEVQANYTLISFMYPSDTESNFRMIKLSKPAEAIKVMFRKASLKLTGIEDIIPLKSRSAVLLMVRSLQILKQAQLTSEQVQIAAQLEAQALKYLQEEEQSKLAYIQTSGKEILPALGVNTNSREVVTAGDVYDDACDILGNIGRQRIFDKITEAQEMLANKSQWDGLDGYIDILSDGRGYISLPRKIEAPIGMNFYKTTAQIRNKWYEFHMNGLGTDPVIGDFVDDLGEYPLAIEPTQPVRLFATSALDADKDLTVRAFGYGNTGQWIRSFENGEYVDGELVPMNIIVPTSSTPPLIKTTANEFRIVSRISKDVTNGVTELFGTATTILPVINTDGTTLQPPNPQLLAIYDTDETEPLFKRIRVPTWVTWIRMRYRARTFKITKMSDVINMRSKTAIVTMIRALKALEAGDMNGYQAFDAAAVKIISDEEATRNPAQTFDLQFDVNTCFADPLQGQY